MMQFKKWMVAALPLGLAVAATPASAGFVGVSASGTPVLVTCEGLESNPNPTLGVCKVTGNLPTAGAPGAFPGLTGTWTLLRSNNNQAVVANGTTIGNMDDRVWRKNGTNDYVLGMRLQLNNVLWSPPAASCGSTTPVYFEVNDMFRNGYAAVSAVSVAYKLAGADDGIFLAGRTSQGLNQYAGSPGGLNPARDNNSIDFRTDVNYDDPDGTSPANSSWQFVSVTLASGTTTAAVANTIRLREGGEEGQCRYEIQLSGFKPA